MVEKIITCENQKAIAFPKSYLGKIWFPELSSLSWYIKRFIFKGQKTKEDTEGWTNERGWL